MKTEQELKDRCTPEFIKWTCEFAEGFSIRGNSVYYYEYAPEWGGRCTHTWCMQNDTAYFPLLIHRAVEGLWKQNKHTIFIHSDGVYFSHNKQSDFKYQFGNYQPQSLTQAECACLNCLLDIFKEEMK